MWKASTMYGMETNLCNGRFTMTTWQNFLGPTETEIRFAKSDVLVGKSETDFVKSDV